MRTMIVGYLSFKLDRFDEVSGTILAMPFGEARQQIDAATRHQHDAARRQRYYKFMRLSSMASCSG